MILELYKSFALLPETYIAHGLAMKVSRFASCRCRIREQILRWARRRCGMFHLHLDDSRRGGIRIDSCDWDDTFVFSHQKEKSIHFHVFTACVHFLFGSDYARVSIEDVCTWIMHNCHDVKTLARHKKINNGVKHLVKTTASIFFFCGCRARSKLWRSSIHWLRLSIPTHENKVKRYLRCLPSNQKAATNTNKQQEQKPNSPTKKQANNQQETGHLVRRVKHYAFKKVPMPLSTASRWNSNITHICPTNPKVIIHCMWQWYKSYWATPGVGSSYQNCSTVIATTASRCPINFSQCSSM